MTITITCPRCGRENEMEDDNDSLVCDRCDAILLVSDDDGKIKVTVA